MQVDPIKPTLKASGTKRLKLKYDEPLSKLAFKFNLRRYITKNFDTSVHLQNFFMYMYGALFNLVGWCRLTL